MRAASRGRRPGPGESYGDKVTGGTPGPGTDRESGAPGGAGTGSGTGSGTGRCPRVPGPCCAVERASPGAAAAGMGVEPAGLSPPRPVLRVPGGPPGIPVPPPSCESPVSPNRAPRPRPPAGRHHPLKIPRGGSWWRRGAGGPVLLSRWSRVVSLCLSIRPSVCPSVLTGGSGPSPWRRNPSPRTAAGCWRAARWALGTERGTQRGWGQRCHPPPLAAFPGSVRRNGGSGAGFGLPRHRG